MNTSNNVYLPEINIMAKKTERVNEAQYKIGDFHLGKIGTQFYIWDKDNVFNLQAKEFPDAKNEAYDVVFKYYHDRRMIPPPKPRERLSP